MFGALSHGGVAVECRTWSRSQVRVSAGHHGVKTLGKFLTPMCLCHQAVQLGTGKRAVALRLGRTDTMVRVWVAGKNCVIPLLHVGRV